jgi:SOS-response transcriptional repressor LexA
MTLGNRIKQLRENKGWNKKELASRVGVVPSNITGWENNEYGPNPTQRAKLCDVFGITIADLYGVTPKTQDYPVQKVPIISWVHANKFEPIAEPIISDVNGEYIFSTTKGKRVFALKVHNDCMEPKFSEGDIIIVDPDAAVKHDDFVVVADRDANTATFKQYKQYGNKKILHPLNPKYKDLELDHEHRYHVIGKVIMRETRC